ncbi:FH2 domain containing 3 isoform X2 [Gadus chalcogrammus]|nr:FH2 domain containing 3 isoform X2 [Gadus chalcogrammus]XP_056451484.1 FH2 domain containing 3 isoform X2 [Gadus chalcogrammus]
MNIAIFLKTFKRPVPEMVEDIIHGNWLRFGTGKLGELCKLLPDTSEVKKLCAFNGNVSHLAEADRFMVQLVRVPGYDERLKTMVLREEFFPQMEEMKTSVDVMTKAANELLDCDDLHSVIRLVLKAGNYMNAGGHSGNAIGFRMNSLLQLSDTKANKPGMNLMHYVAKQAEDIDAELLTFPSQLEHIAMASRICQEEVKADFEREVKKIEEVQLYASRQPSLLQQMETFLLRARLKLSDLSSSLSELGKLSEAVAEFFCEDPAAFKLEDCCSVFSSFCQKFLTAIQDNRLREALELRRKCKDSARGSIKRRSTWSGQEPRAVGKRYASSETLDSSSGDQEAAGLESALHSFLAAAAPNRCRRKLIPVEMGPLLELSNSLTEAPSSRSEGLVETLAAPLLSLETTLLPGLETTLLPCLETTLLPCLESTLLPSPEEKDLPLTAENQEDGQTKRAVISYQNCRGKGTGADWPRHSDSTLAALAVPATPLSTTRDYILRSNGPSCSPWTIVSPFSNPEGNGNPRNRHSRHSRRAFSISDADEQDDGCWPRPPIPSSCSSTTITPSTFSGSSALEDPTEDRGGGGGAAADFPSGSPDNLASRRFVPEYPAEMPLSLGPLLRSCSLDETRTPPVHGSWWGELIQKSIAHRTKSCSSSRANSPTDDVFTSKEGGGSGLISFFRRFGNKSKAPDSRVLNYGEAGL